jgi:hypothetical protein
MNRFQSAARATLNIDATAKWGGQSLKPMSRQKTSIDKSKSAYETELFTVRLWREVLNDHSEWRGKVLHGRSHRERYFREWETLIGFLQEILSDEGSQSEPQEP